MAKRANSPVRPGGMNHPPFDAVADVRKAGHIQDDFVTNLNGTLDDTHPGIGALNWVITDVNGAADSDVDVVTPAAGQFGVVQLNTGPTAPAAGDEGSLFLSNPDGFVLQDAAVYGCAVVTVPTAASTEVRFGLFDDAAAAGRGTNGVCLEYDASVNAYWQSVTTAGGSSTATAVPAEGQVAVSDGDTFTLEIMATDDSCLFFVNGVLVNEETATIPTVGMTFGFKVTTETGAERGVQIDAFQGHWVVDRTNK